VQGKNRKRLSLLEEAWAYNPILECDKFADGFEIMVILFFYELLGKQMTQYFRMAEWVGC